MALEAAILNGTDGAAPAYGLREAACVGNGANLAGICRLGGRACWLWL